MSVCRWFLGIGISVVMSLFAHANDDDELYRLKTYVPILMASPPVCELDANRQFCRLSASLVWEVPKAGDYCLYFVEQDKFLQCWKNKWAGVFEFNMYASSDAHFMLIRGQNGTIAAKAKLAVVGSIQQQENAKGKTGFWRIF